MTNWWYLCDHWSSGNKIYMYRYVQNKARSMNLFTLYVMKMQPRYDVKSAKSCTSHAIPRLNLHHIKREQVHWTCLVLDVSKLTSFKSWGAELLKSSSVCHLTISWFQSHQFIIFMDSEPKPQGLAGKISPAYMPWNQEPGKCTKLSSWYPDLEQRASMSFTIFLIWFDYSKNYWCLL